MQRRAPAHVVVVAGAAAVVVARTMAAKALPSPTRHRISNRWTSLTRATIRARLVLKRLVLKRLVSKPRVLKRRVLKRLRPEEHTSELQSLMHNSYAVYC